MVDIQRHAEKSIHASVCFGFSKIEDMWTCAALISHPTYDGRAVYLSLLGHQTHVGNMSHGGVIKLPVFLAIINNGTVDASIAAVGDDAHNILKCIVLVPHHARVTHDVGHGGIDDHVAGDMQVGDTLGGVDHGQTRAASISGLREMKQ